MPDFSHPQVITLVSRQNSKGHPYSDFSPTPTSPMKLSKHRQQPSDHSISSITSNHHDHSNTLLQRVSLSMLLIAAVCCLTVLLFFNQFEFSLTSIFSQPIANSSQSFLSSNKPHNEKKTKRITLSTSNSLNSTKSTKSNKGSKHSKSGKHGSKKSISTQGHNLQDIYTIYANSDHSYSNLHWNDLFNPNHL